MKTTIEIDAEPRLQQVIDQSLESDRKVTYCVKQENGLKIQVETETLGQLRGAVDTCFRLSMLGNKILQR